VYISADKFLSIRLHVQILCMAFPFPGLIIIIIVTDSIWSPAGLIICSEVESIQSRWVHLDSTLPSPMGSGGIWRTLSRMAESA
jgi:hypothetical protein